MPLLRGSGAGEGPSAGCPGRGGVAPGGRGASLSAPAPRVSGDLVGSPRRGTGPDGPGRGRFTGQTPTGGEHAQGWLSPPSPPPVFLTPPTRSPMSCRGAPARAGGWGREGPHPSSYGEGRAASHGPRPGGEWPPWQVHSSKRVGRVSPGWGGAMKTSV